MKRWISGMVVAICLLPLGGVGEGPPPGATSDEASVRFTGVDVYVDPKGEPLAAYQFELKARGAEVTLVGVEGGDDPAYLQPPYYDPKANLQNRIVIAAFNTGAKLPRQKTRVARIMLRVKGSGPQYSAKLEVAASADARPIHADISVVEGATP